MIRLLGVWLFVATRGLLRSRLTTALLILAVAAGVGFQIPNTANLLGYTHTMLEEVTTRGFGDVRVQHAAEPIMEDGDAIADAIGKLPGVRAAVPIVTLPAGLLVRGRQLVCEAHGVDPRSATKPYRIRSGNDLAPDDEGVLVGSGLADKLGVKVGDTVELRVLFPAAKGIEGATPTVAEYKRVVRGTAQGTFGAHSSVFVTRDTFVRAMARPKAASRVLVYRGLPSTDKGVSEVRRDVPKATRELASNVGKVAPSLEVATWMDENPVADSAIRGNEVLGVVSHTMVVIAVTIPVAALLFVTVESRRREVAMLAALGFAQAEIFVAFLLQALVVGVVGIAFGCALGGALLRWFAVHPIFESAEFVIRPVVAVDTFTDPALVILITTLCAALVPAWRATRVDPARVLRSGA